MSDFVPDSVTWFENILSSFTGFRIWILKLCSSVRGFVGCITRFGFNESCVRLMLFEKARCVDAPC